MDKITQKRYGKMNIENHTSVALPENVSTNPAKDYREANLLALMLGGILSGSAVVNQITANDMDVFIPNWVHGLAMSSGEFIDKPNRWIWYMDRYELVSYTPEQKSEEYEQAQELGEIVELYRGRNRINLIVVANEYWAAYLGAHRKLTERPDLYINKAKRHNLFISHKNVVREWLGKEMHPLKDETEE